MNDKLQKDDAIEIFQEINDILQQSVNDQNPDLRKNVIFCLVEFKHLLEERIDIFLKQYSGNQQNAKNIPMPEKEHTGGEDAYYANSKLLAVADGVGGWARQGIDSSLYSKGLCKHLSQLHNQNKNKYQNNPKQLIIDTFPYVQQITGSSTLVVITINEEQNKIFSSYIGDSGYFLYRLDKNKNAQLIFEFQEQQKAFNLTLLSKNQIQLGIHEGGNLPEDSLEFEHDFQEDDILIIGSDGVFDNLNSEQIGKLVTKYSHSLKRLANVIAETSFELSLNEEYDSPFAQKARAQGIQFNGGKSDDITIIVAQIKKKKKIDL
ncbi:hypothetical protein IMG5_178880 [Ichthyophthirius multifiliis]|uniref:Protein phosphatase n=1 Tax=Ichthyophthirius multifiliis TaxID=5932 RepID=G0R2J6_ICHMU|nr:hypothetical protein IMG5_178880 [Ichthyophthirius multifiliis]EGR28308.1 hypothetical protein IMG5_178880 [Ichthyophthirius multifiliis]|eukprot:XP_004027653.1 hypothetical protein IMG5_178880 [Ichthyophthirius multifiliis]